MNPRCKKAKGAGCGGPYQPTPGDIRNACDHIQEKWSEKERDKRAGHLAEGQWTPPSVNWSAVTDAVREDQRADLARNSSV